MAIKPGISVKVVKNRLDGELQGEIKHAVAERIEYHARKIEAGAKRDIAVATGTARRGIHTVIADDGLSATVAGGTDYDIWIERGNGRTPARPFMIPNFEREVPLLVADLRKILG